MTRGYVTLTTDGLLSKWGFGDGDVLDDVLDEHGYADVYYEPGETAARDADVDRYGFDHRVLIRVVREYVLPQVRAHHDIEVSEVSTIHNPIRARLLDGQDVDDYNPRYGLLTPATVEVPVSAILAIAKEERARYAGPDSARRPGDG